MVYQWLHLANCYNKAFKNSPMRTLRPVKWKSVSFIPPLQEDQQIQIGPHRHGFQSHGNWNEGWTDL